jgi:hypothetical protein
MSATMWGWKGMRNGGLGSKDRRGKIEGSVSAHARLDGWPPDYANACTSICFPQAPCACPGGELRSDSPVAPLLCRTCTHICLIMRTHFMLLI